MLFRQATALPRYPTLRIPLFRHTAAGLSSPFHVAAFRRTDDFTSRLVYPDPPTTNHHDLTSFLTYAHRTGLDPKSTVYVGTHYEYTAASSMARYGLSLKRIGGASDYGIDLVGVWRVPCFSDAGGTREIRVLCQCKGGSQKIGPHLIRELEGAFVGAPVGWRGAGVLGFLISEQTATKGVRDSLGRSRWPMGFVSCRADGSVRQIIWNRRAEDEGLAGLGVTMRHVDGSDGSETQLVLTWKDRPLPLLEV